MKLASKLSELASEVQQNFANLYLEFFKDNYDFFVDEVRKDEKQPNYLRDLANQTYWLNTALMHSEDLQKQHGINHGQDLFTEIGTLLEKSKERFAEDFKSEFLENQIETAYQIMQSSDGLEFKTYPAELYWAASLAYNQLQACCNADELECEQKRQELRKEDKND